MEINGEFKMKSTDILLKERGLEDMGRVQKYIDSEVIRLMDPYTPMRSGTLKQAFFNTRIGSGLIVQSTPYARYQYYGKKYGPNIPIIRNGIVEGWFSPPVKQPTGENLHYQGEPQRGAFWFERMKTDHATDILKGAQAEANKGV